MTKGGTVLFGVCCFATFLLEQHYDSFPLGLVAFILGCFGQHFLSERAT